MVLQNQTTRYNKEDIHDPPVEGKLDENISITRLSTNKISLTSLGVYVYGLFLEGKRFLNICFMTYKDVMTWTWRFAVDFHEKWIFKKLSWCWTLAEDSEALEILFLLKSSISIVGRILSNLIDVSTVMHASREKKVKSFACSRRIFSYNLLRWNFNFLLSGLLTIYSSSD